MTTRRNFIKTGSALAGAAALGSRAQSSTGGRRATPSNHSTGGEEFWPDGARLVISASMQFEAGGEPAFGLESPFSGTPLPKGVPDLPAQTWFQYGYREGIPRLLDLWDKHGVKVTSHMVGAAVERNPQLAQEIVERGHEGAAHGMAWDDQFDMSRDEELHFVANGVAAVKEVTGVTPLGYNCNWLRRSTNTLSVLQELGFTYHIDDLSRDEPFMVRVDGEDFCVVPYTLRANDIALIEGRHFSSQQFGAQLKNEFDQLYAESAGRRRMMSLSTHDRIGGTPGVVRVLDDFITYALKQPGVRFMRKDQIAAFASTSKLTPRES